LICANYTADTVSIFTNNGNGVFASNTTVNASIDPGDVAYSVTAADIYGKGHPALVCAEYYGHSLVVLTNNGSGRYGSNTMLNVGLTVTWGAAADVNGDGKVDLLTVLNYGNSVVVFTNNGSGIFSSNASYAVGNYPLEVVAADLNNDGKMDLIGVNLFDTSLSVLTNATPFSRAGSRPAAQNQSFVHWHAGVMAICLRRLVIAAEFKSHGEALAAQWLRRVRHCRRRNQQKPGDRSLARTGIFSPAASVNVAQASNRLCGITLPQ
jgi:hypothetical protein